MEEEIDNDNQPRFVSTPLNSKAWGGGGWGVVVRGVKNEAQLVLN